VAVRAGLDLVEVDEIRVSIAVHACRYLDRVFTEREVADCRGPDDVLDVRGLAARLAAKEATLKALGAEPGGLALRSVEVVREGGGRVALVLSGAAERLARGRGVARLALSLTQTERQAGALVLAWDGPS